MALFFQASSRKRQFNRDFVCRGCERDKKAAHQHFEGLSKKRREAIRKGAAQLRFWCRAAIKYVSCRLRHPQPPSIALWSRLGDTEKRRPTKDTSRRHTPIRARDKSRQGSLSLTKCDTFTRFKNATELLHLAAKIACTRRFTSTDCAAVCAADSALIVQMQTPSFVWHFIYKYIRVQRVQLLCSSLVGTLAIYCACLLLSFRCCRRIWFYRPFGQSADCQQRKAHKYIQHALCCLRAATIAVWRVRISLSTQNVNSISCLINTHRGGEWNPQS